MTEEEKHNLLRKDLCARFPYNVKLKVKYEDDPWTLFVMHQSEKIYVLGVKGYPIEVKLTDCQPYLRPMSSMTQEEKQEYQRITERWMYDSSYSISDSFDWLNAHHFDYRGLIEKGLAIDATGLNIYSTYGKRIFG